MEAMDYWREGRLAQKISQFIERQFKRIGIRLRMNNFSARLENKLRKCKIKNTFSKEEFFYLD